MFILSKKEIVKSQGVKSFVAISNISANNDIEIKKMEISTAGSLLVDIIPIFITDILEENRSEIEILSLRLGQEVDLKETVRTFGQFALIQKARPLKSYVLDKGNTVVFDDLDKLVIPPLTALVVRVNTQHADISVNTNITFDIKEHNK